ncbi:hypothetical protein Tco_1498404 [Tanacetum coccineum]
MGQNSAIPPADTQNTTTSSSYPTNNRFRLKRNTNTSNNPISKSFSSSSDRRRSHGHGLRSSSIGGLFRAGAGAGTRRTTLDLDLGTSLRFLPNLPSGTRLHRTKPTVGVRSPRLAIIDYMSFAAGSHFENLLLDRNVLLATRECSM